MLEFFKSKLFRFLAKMLIDFLTYVVDHLDELDPDDSGGPSDDISESSPLCLFPMEHLRVTQDELSEYSHAGSYAMDLNYPGDVLYAPCDMRVVRVRPNANGELYTESLEPVFTPKGLDYVRFCFLHDPRSENSWSEGDVIRLGDWFYSPGGMGSGNPNQFAAHVHVEVGFGRWSDVGGASMYQNHYGTWQIPQQAHLYDVFFLNTECKVENGAGHNWQFQPYK